MSPATSSQEPSQPDSSQIDQPPVAYQPPSLDSNSPSCSEIPSARSSGSLSAPSGSNGVLKRPPTSYRELAARAIMSSPDRCMTVTQIYTWIMDRHPYYRETTTKWKRNVRSHLCRYNCFVQNGKHSFENKVRWAIHSSYVQAFKKGDFDARFCADSTKGVEGPSCYVPRSSGVWVRYCPLTSPGQL